MKSLTITEISKLLTDHQVRHRIDGNGEIEVWFHKNNRQNIKRPWEVVQFAGKQRVMDFIDSPSGY